MEKQTLIFTICKIVKFRLHLLTSLFLKRNTICKLSSLFNYKL